MIRRLGAVLTAIAMTFTFASPLLAYNTAGPTQEWEATSQGYAVIPLCARANFDSAVTGGWDFNTSLHARVRDAVQEFNSLGLKLTYTFTNVACGDLTINHLTVGWANSDENYADSIAYYQTTDTTDGFCITHCLEVGHIFFDKNGAITGGSNYTWYTYLDPHVPLNTFGFGEVVLHELGHASGLDHSAVANSIMCSTDQVSNCYHTNEIVYPGVMDLTYDPDDIAGFCAAPWDDDPNRSGNVC